MRTVRRYSNRKIYDTFQHHYVTLADLAAIIRSGEEIRVLAHDTSADLTAQTMAQIIAEEEKKGSRVSPEILSKILREGLAA
jgi:polyhydroxyalkanoate synthesis repressor PhaR